jgi:hypothetical protein
LCKVTSLFGNSSKAVINTVSSGGEMMADVLGNGVERVQTSMTSFNTNAGYFKDGGGTKGTKNYQHDKLSGK